MSTENITQINEYDNKEYLLFIYNFLTDDTFVDKLKYEDYKREYFLLVDACNNEDVKDCLDCYILKTLHKILSKYLFFERDRFYEIILNTYYDILCNLDRIKNIYEESKSSFRTYIYFYMKKYLYKNIKESIENDNIFLDTKKIDYELLMHLENQIENDI